jgi:hypothetical protein
VGACVYEDPRGARHWVHLRATDLYAVGSLPTLPEDISAELNSNEKLNRVLHSQIFKILGLSFSRRLLFLTSLAGMLGLAIIYLLGSVISEYVGVSMLFPISHEISPRVGDK